MTRTSDIGDSALSVRTVRALIRMLVLAGVLSLIPVVGPPVAAINLSC
jgi:predicted PurR-regulated permease PerM